MSAHTLHIFMSVVMWRCTLRYVRDVHDQVILYLDFWPITSKSEKLLGELLLFFLPLVLFHDFNLCLCLTLVRQTAFTHSEDTVLPKGGQFNGGNSDTVTK